MTLNQLHQIAADLLGNPLTCLTITLISYQAGLWIYAKTRQFPLFHPVLIGALPMVGLIQWGTISYQDYFQHTELLYFLLGPATVALAIPLHAQFHHIRSLFLPILIALPLGALAAVAVSWYGAQWLGATEHTLLSLAPKSVTTPIAMGVADKLGGLPALTAGVVVATGVIGAVASPWLFRLLNIQDPRIKGFTLGLNAHGVGTAKAFEDGPVCGAFASLGLGLTGAITALSLHWVVGWLP